MLLLPLPAAERVGGTLARPRFAPRGDSQESDVFLDDAFEAARVRLVHLPAQAIYKIEGIVELLRASS